MNWNTEMEKVLNATQRGADPKLSDCDPKISVTLLASDWVEIFESRRHYFEILEAVERGGDHRGDCAKNEMIYEAVAADIKRAVMARTQGGSADGR